MKLTDNDKLDIAKECGGSGSDVEKLLSLPGRLESICGAWWHIPCYNEATPEGKEAATIRMQEQWDEIAEKWKKRGTRHCNGGPGGAEHQARMMKELGPEKYAQHVKKVKRDTDVARLKRARMREAQNGR